MQPRFLYLLPVVWLSLAYSLPAQTVHLTGTVDVSIAEGTLSADITLHNLPQNPEYAILLNGGLNLALVTDSSGTTTYAVNREWKGEVSYEAFHYWLPANDGQGRYIPPSLRMTYTGKFPVYTDTTQMSNWEDWKGNIAFNGSSVRASDQSVWYPMFYDLATGERQEAVTYDLTINCADCSTIYLGGQTPVRSASARLSSELPVPLMLFAGEFDFAQSGDLTYINTDLTDAQQRTVTDTTRAIQTYYSELLGLPYGSPITYLSATPVATKPQWGFVTYPAIVRVGFGYGFGSMLDTTGNVKGHEVAFLAHELAHYYFGTHYRPNGPLFWFLLEGGAEYLALQYVRDQGTTAEYSELLSRYIAAVGEREDFPRLAAVAQPSEIGNAYRYSFVPLLLMQLERKTGREQVLRLVKNILHSPTSTADYAFLLAQLSKAGIDQSTFEAAEQELLGLPLDVQQFVELDQRPRP